MTVYTNTDKPFSQWKPTYEIVMLWDGGAPKFEWVPSYTVETGKRIAEELAKEYERQKRFNMHRTQVARYKKVYLDTACVFLNKMGYSAEVEYHDIKQQTCRTVTIRKK